MITLDTLIPKLDLEGEGANQIIVLARHPSGRRKLSVRTTSFYEMFGTRVETENAEDPENPIITYTNKTYDDVEAFIAADNGRGYAPYIEAWSASGILED